MTDRRDKRFARRLQVRFWERGSSPAITAYTTNISVGGMFVGTSAPLGPGTRLRVELLHEKDGFILEGVVIHAARVSPLLKKLKESGMGIRLLSVPEMVAEILPAVLTVEEAEPDEERKAVEDDESGEEVVATDASEVEATADEPPTDESPPDVEVEKRRPPKPEPLLTRTGRTFHLDFDSLPHFLTVLKRDISAGGIFVPTSTPAAMHERVSIEIQIPAPVGRTVRIPGTVVQVAGPNNDDSDDGNLLAGIGVQFLDPEKVVRQFEALIYTD